jgi:hypothetical protein
VIMKGRWAFIGHGALALALVGFAAACGADDDDDDLPNAGVGGASGAGAGGASGASGSAAGSGGNKAGAGGGGGGMSMITPAMCVTNSMAETNTAMACLMCICEKNAAVIDKVGMAGWKLIECIGEKCDGDGADVPCIQAMCMAQAGAMGAIGEATPTSPVFPMCMMQCGIGDMAGGDAGI